MTADSACLFVAATGIRPQGQLAYTKALSASFGAMGFENHPLRVLAKALRGGGAAIPDSQATPLEKQKLVSHARLQQPSVHLALLVAWKTASRWAEVADLSSAQFLLVTQKEVIVDWFQTPKGRTHDPFKASRFAVIQGPLTTEIAMLFRKCAPFAPLTRLTTSALDSLWGQSVQMQGYTAHSIKRGAVKHLLPLLTSGKLSPHLVDRLTKHEEEGGPGTLSRTTLRSTGPGPFASVPFTVLEEKDGALRQRFILWTVDGNRAAHERGYEAHVPLGHVSAYLGASREECGSTRDFKTGFYAIEIPPESRHLFRFADSGGGWWELLRLPMGHSCAPEIMHTLAAVAGGHADYVLPQFAERDVTVDIWVDNIRYAGKRSAVQLATRRLDQTAADCDLTWKPSDSQTAATR
ncbi:hypothetical protein DIPPA_07247, partial [Diplonema papillatum]